MRSVPLLLLLLAFGKSQAQDEHAEHAHEHGTDHVHPVNELGVANSLVTFIDEQEFSYGLHVHYLHQLPGSRFRLGAGLERIFDVHRHNTLGVVAGYGLAHGWSVLLSPGVTFEDEDPAALLPALHVEMTYEVDIGALHLGPVIEWAWDPEDMHVSLGLHVGIGLQRRDHR